MLLRSPCEVSEPYDNPFWDFSNGGTRRERLIPKIVAYLVARTSLGPISKYRNILVIIGAESF